MNQNFYYFWDRIIKMNSTNMKSLNIALIIALFISIFACNNPNDEIVVVPGTQAAKERTIILYLSGDEYKISRWIGDNIDLICENLNSSVDSEKVNIVAFVDILSSYGSIPANPIVYEIKYNKTKNIVDTTSVKQYPELNSLSVSHIKDFLSMVKEKYPAETYNLIWGSHGSGWYPNPNLVKNRALGPDGNSYIELDEFEQAIPEDMVFDYIIFDACFMAQAEIAMQLKDKVKYIMSAPSEIPIAGFPYKDINLMCNARTEEDYIAICESFHTKYILEGIGHTVSLIKTDEMDNLASAFKQVIESCDDETLRNFNISNVQNFDGQQYCFNYITACYDLQNIAYQLIDNETLYENLTNAIKKVIKYEAHSQLISFGTTIRIKTCCGITSFWPTKGNAIANTYYYNYDWCKASGLDYIINYIIE